MKKAIEVLILGTTPENSTEVKIAINILEQFCNTEKNINYTELIKLLKIYEINYSDLKSQKEDNQLQIKKHCIVYHLYNHTKSKIGTARIVQKDHSTIISSIKHVNNWLSLPRNFTEEIKVLN